MDPIDFGDMPRPAELSKSFFRATSTHLSHEGFEEKWTRALDSPVRFFRAFPQAYWLMLDRVPAKHVPGRCAICFGDPHPENFGFLLAGGRFHFAPNDLDDAGPGEVGADALRFFVAHLLTHDDIDRTVELIDHYRLVLRDPSAATEVPPELVPDPAKVRGKRFSQLVDAERLIRNKETGLDDTSDEETARVREVFEHTPELGRHAVLDIAQRIRHHGGSGGLRRYFVLARADRTLDVLELKELTRPAVLWGHHRTPLMQRIPHVRAALFAGIDIEDHFTVDICHVEFLVRSRLTRAKVDLGALRKKDLYKVYRAETSLLAARHRGSFDKSDHDAIGKWLEKSASAIADYFTVVFEDLRTRRKR